MMNQLERIPSEFRGFLGEALDEFKENPICLKISAAAVGVLASDLALAGLVAFGVIVLPFRRRVVIGALASVALVATTASIAALTFYFLHKDATQRASLLVLGDMKTQENVAILAAIRKIPFRERDDVIQRAWLLINDHTTGYGKVDILNAIRETSPGERDDVMNRTLLLTRLNDDRFERNNAGILLNAIRKIPSGQRNDVIKQASPLMHDLMYRPEKAAILDAIREILPAEREDVIDRALCLMRDDMTGLMKIAILTAIQKIPFKEREDVFNRALPLMSAHMSGLEIAAILNAIRKTPSKERDNVIDRGNVVISHAWFWVRVNMNGIEKAAILNAIRLVPSVERAPRGARTFEQLQTDLANKKIDKIDDYVNRFQLLLATPLDKAIYSL